MQDFLVAPSAGKRRARELVPPMGRVKVQEEYWRFSCSDDLLLKDGSTSGAFAGGDLVRHYNRVDKAGADCGTIWKRLVSETLQSSWYERSQGWPGESNAWQCVSSR